MSKRIRERIHVGTDANGQPIYEWATGYTKQEVFESAAAILQKYKKVEVAAGKDSPRTPYFSTYLEEWWRLYKLPKLRHTTLKTYRNLIDNHILPAFKGLRPEDIKTNTIQQFYQNKSAMALSSVKQMSKILHQVFDLAVEDGHMRVNPTESKRLFIKGTEKKRNALPDAAVREIMKDMYLLESKDRLLLALFLYTGMRRGEVLGLRWENIDWKRRLIFVEQAVTFHNNQPILGDPKSEAGKRSIPLDERLVNILRPHRQLNGFIIGDGLRPVTERTFIRTWQRIGRTINLYDATPHVFRHTYLTIAASSGLDIKTLQSIAGHADIQMTMNCYVHKREEKVMEAGDLIAGSFTAL